jgi:hypothetical protein
MITTTTKSAILFILTLFFSACGGGGSSQSAPPQDPSDTYSVTGLVQKGPFIIGSSITIQELDDNKSYWTIIRNRHNR